MRKLFSSTMLLVLLLFSLGMTQNSASALKLQTASQSSSVTGPRYTITDLGTLGGASEAWAISNNGKVAGRYATGSGSTYNAFYWENGIMHGLGTLGGVGSEAHGVNDNGQVVGTSYTSSGYQGAFLWQNGSMQNLGTLGGNGAGALAINKSGQVAGWAINSKGQMRAFLWSGSMADLGALSGGQSYAYGINDAGQVVGFASVGSMWPYYNHAFLYSGSMQDLGTLGYEHSQAMGLNDNGDVVGNLANTSPEPDVSHGFLSQGGGLQDLGGTPTFAYDINNSGLIVGESEGHAVLWENGQMQDLNTLIPANSGWVLLNARAINNRGQIVGKGTFNGQTRAFLLTTTSTFRSQGTNDGWILESTETSGVGGLLDSAATTFNLGDDAARKQYRVILSFNTSSLPDTAVITKVTLKVKQQGVTGGGNPVSTFQGFMADVRKGPFGSASLTLSDFSAAANKTVGPTSPALVSGWYSLNLTAAKAYINKLSSGSGLTQIRLRFKLDDNNNSIANFLSLFSGNAPTASRPQLIIEYYTP